MDKYSYMSNADVNAIDELYNQYIADANNVEEGWRTFFDGFEFARKTTIPMVKYQIT